MNAGGRATKQLRPPAFMPSISPKVIVGVLVAKQEVLQSFGLDELQIHFATESQNHDKEGQQPSMIRDLRNE